MSLRGTLTKPRWIKQMPGGQQAAAPALGSSALQRTAGPPHPRCGPQSLAELRSLSRGARLFPHLRPLSFSQTEEPKLPPPPRARFQVLPRWLLGSATATLRPGRQPSSPCTKCPTGVNSVPELTGSVSGSVPLRMGDGDPCPGRRQMHFRALQPTRDPHPQPGRVVSPAGTGFLGPVPIGPALM